MAFDSQTVRVRVDCFAGERLGWKKFVGRFVNEAIRRQHLLLFTVTSGMEPKLAFLPSSAQSVLLIRQRIKASFVLSENPQHARIHFSECAHSDAALLGRKPRKRKYKEKSAPSSESNHHGHNWNQTDAISIW